MGQKKKKESRKIEYSLETVNSKQYGTIFTKIYPQQAELNIYIYIYTRTHFEENSLSVN